MEARNSIRQSPRQAWLIGIAWVVFLMSTGTLPAHGDWYIGGGGGVFVPWKGNTGASAFAQVLYGTESERSRWGLEYEYRDFDDDSDRFDAHAPDFEVHAVRLIGQFHPFPSAHISPYIGAGLSVLFFELTARNQFNGRKFTDEKMGAGAVAIAGAETRLFESLPLLLFAEGRFNADYEFATNGGSDASELRVRQIGGFSGWLGLRARF